MPFGDWTGNGAPARDSQGVKVLIDLDVEAEFPLVDVDLERDGQRIQLTPGRDYRVRLVGDLNDVRLRVSAGILWKELVLDNGTGP